MRWSPWSELRRHPDIWVHRCRLDEGQGWWCPQERVILLDDRLDRRTARCVLAHELAHALLGHAGAPSLEHDLWFAERIERRADRWAARRLLALDDVAEVLAERPACLEDAARALDVTPALLRLRLAALDRCERERLSARLAKVDDAA